MGNSFGPIDYLTIITWNQLAQLLCEQHELPFEWSGLVNENGNSSQQYVGMVIDGVPVRNLRSAVLFINALLGHGAQIRVVYTLVANTVNTYEQLHAAVMQVTRNPAEFELLYRGSEVIGMSVYTNKFFGGDGLVKAWKYTNQCLQREQRAFAIQNLGLE